jgi:hypothetical protein
MNIQRAQNSLQVNYTTVAHMQQHTKFIKPAIQGPIQGTSLLKARQNRSCDLHNAKKTLNSVRERFDLRTKNE